jgi:WD40 repeat protein
LAAILGLIVMVVGLVLAGVGALTKRPGNETRSMLWLGVACLGLVPLGPLSAQNPELRATLKGHMAAVLSVAYSPDGKTLASESQDGTIKLWDVQTGTLAEPPL